MKWIKEILKWVAVILAMIFGYTLLKKKKKVDTKKKISNLKKQKVKKDAFKKCSRTDNISAIRRMLKRSTK